MPSLTAPGSNPLRNPEKRASGLGATDTVTDRQVVSFMVVAREPRAKTKREAIVIVIEEFNRGRRMARLVRYSGTFSDSFPTNDQIEEVDAPPGRHRDGLSR